ncbi:MAG TPA: hypothetical protein EYH42_02000 [Sulfurovum sp.]|nr:hypothetical protein [Sulfurovum sp.]
MRTILENKIFKKTINKVYVFFVDHRNTIIKTFAAITVMFGLLGYCISAKSTGLEVINNTISLFVFNWADDDSMMLDIAKLSAIFTVFSGMFSLYVTQTINSLNVKQVQKKPYILLLGLGKQNRSFLASDSVKKDYSKILIIESDSTNPDIERFQKYGSSVIVDNAKEAIKSLDLTMMENAIISTGSDGQNIAISMVLLDLCIKGKNKKIFTRIENHNMKNLFNQNILESNEKVEIHAYSLYENMVKELFSRHTILGLQEKIIKTNESYNIVLVGTSELAIEIISFLSILSNLPEENIINIYLIDLESKKFYEKIKKLFAKIENIPHLNIIPFELDADTSEFYTDKVWDKINLTNIFIATEDENRNIDIAITLQNNTYLKRIVKDTFRTKVFFAVYNNLGLRDKINGDKKLFSNFYTFGDIK